MQGIAGSTLFFVFVGPQGGGEEALKVKATVTLGSFWRPPLPAQTEPDPAQLVRPVENVPGRQDTKGASRGGRAPVRTVERWFGWTQELEERGWSGEPGTASLSLGRLKRRVICTGMGRVLPLDGVAAGCRDRSKVFL